MQPAFDRLVDALPGLVWAMDAEGHSDYVNCRWCEYTGLAAAQLLGDGWRSAVHSDDLQLLRDSWMLLRSTGNSGEIEVRLRRFDGEYRWFALRLAPFDHGWCGMASCSDEKEPGVPDRRLQRFVDDLPTHVIFLTPAGELEYVSREAREFFGQTVEELKNWATSGVIHPDDLPATFERVQRTLSEGAPYDSTIRMRRNDGTYVWIRSRMLPSRDAHGNVVRYCAIQSDVDELKRGDMALRASEAELRRAHTHLTAGQRLSRTGSFTWDMLADEHTWSEEIYRIFGFPPGTRVTMQMIQSAIHPEDMPAVETLLGNAIHQPGFDLVFRILDAEGEVRHAHVVGHRSEQITDRPVFLGALRDITESKVTEAALNKARAELTHVTRVMSLGALTASIAHEVNQPLAGIVTNATTCQHLLAADPPNVDGARAMVQRLLRDGNRAAEVIQRLRQLFARKQPSTDDVDLNDAAREVLTLSSSELHRSRIVLRTNLDASLPPVRGDRLQLQQVMLNLLLNAADAMRAVQDRPRDLVVETSSDGDSGVRLSVRDSGVGINPHTVERLFDPFFTTKPHGMGMGLSISRTIIESHNGRLWATVNERAGATFSFSIPARVHVTGPAE